MTAFFREPLVHFLLGGAVILLVFTLFDEAPRPVSNTVLEVTEADIDRLATRFQATWRRPPTQDEMDGLIDQLIRQEVLVREALALGLDRNDEVVRQRLVQKMTFLAEGSVAALAPTDGILETHLRENQDQFKTPASIAFRHVLLRDGVDMAEALAALRQEGDVRALIKPILLPERFPLTTTAVIDRAFGTGFSEALIGAPPGAWSGPVQSAYGQHAVWVETVVPATLPRLDEVREAVEFDWRDRRRADVLEERIQALRSGYEIILPDSQTGASQ